MLRTCGAAPACSAAATRRTVSSAQNASGGRVCRMRCGPPDRKWRCRGRQGRGRGVRQHAPPLRVYRQTDCLPRHRVEAPRTPSFPAGPSHLRCRQHGMLRVRVAVPRPQVVHQARQQARVLRHILQGCARLDASVHGRSNWSCCRLRAGRPEPSAASCTACRGGAGACRGRWRRRRLADEHSTTGRHAQGSNTFHDVATLGMNASQRKPTSSSSKSSSPSMPRTRGATKLQTREGAGCARWQRGKSTAGRRRGTAQRAARNGLCGRAPTAREGSHLNSISTLSTPDTWVPLLSRVCTGWAGRVRQKGRRRSRFSPASRDAHAHFYRFSMSAGGPLSQAVRAARPACRPNARPQAMHARRQSSRLPPPPPTHTHTCTILIAISRFMRGCSSSMTDG